jgi:hypothetical protein
MLGRSRRSARQVMPHDRRLGLLQFCLRRLRVSPITVVEVIRIIRSSSASRSRTQPTQVPQLRRPHHPKTSLPFVDTLGHEAKSSRLRAGDEK